MTVDEENYTKEEIAKKVNRSPSFIYLKWDELSRTCNCNHKEETHRNDHCHYLVDLTQCNCKSFSPKLKKAESGFIIREKSNRGVQTFDDIKKTNFIKLASVKRWSEALKKSGNKNWKFMITNMWRICTTLDIHPDMFLQEIETAEDMKDKFVLALRDGKAVYIYNYKKKDPEKQSRVNPQPYIEAIRSFRDRNSKDIPKGFLKIDRIPSDSYARIHLNDKERKVAISILKKMNPVFADLFIIQHEIGIRIDTLFTIKPIIEKKFTIIDGQECSYWKALIHEKKQNRNFEKFFWTPEARSVIAKLESGKPIHNFKNNLEGKREYNKALRLMYSMLGKISEYQNKWNDYEIGTEEYYLVNDPSHAVRHSAVHKLMRMTGERADDVASMFWDRPETLKIYQQTSIDSILQQGLCMICNIPPQGDQNYERFCSLRHAVLYYNGYRVED